MIPAPNRLFLIGMPGAGKTTLGRGLAALYSLPFRDLDEEIVQAEGRSIAAIFAAEGEDYFRQREAAVLRATVQAHPRLLLATGGGTPCFQDNLQVLLSTGLTLYLAVPVPELARRLHAGLAQRPLLANLPSAEALEKQLHKTLSTRQQFYEQAPLRCMGPDCTVEAVQLLLTRYLTTA